MHVTTVSLPYKRSPRLRKPGLKLYQITAPMFMPRCARYLPVSCHPQHSLHSQA
jgi:hypothetical protein